MLLDYRVTVVKRLAYLRFELTPRKRGSDKSTVALQIRTIPEESQLLFRQYLMI
jgi:hypothetical protein